MFQGRGQFGFQFFAMHDKVQESMLEDELASLETGGQIALDGFFDHLAVVLQYSDLLHSISLSWI